MKIRRQLIRLTMVTVIPVTLIAIGFVTQLIQNERQAIQRHTLETARALSNSVDTEIRRSITALQMLTLSRALAQDDIPEFRQQAEAALHLHGRWSNFALNAADGAQLLNLRGSSERESAALGARDPAIAGALATAVRDRAPAVSNMGRSRTSGKPTVVVVVPYSRNGGVRYLLTASIEYDAWTEWLRAQVPPGWIGAIDDREGRVMARTERAESFVGNKASPQALDAYARSSEETVKAVNREGVAVYSSFATSPLTGWHTLIIVPAQLLDSPADRRIAALAAGAAVALLVALLLAYAAARPAIVAVARLRDAVAALGRGERVSFEATRIDEIDEVGASIVKADDLLRKRENDVQSLQRQLADRAEAAEEASRAKDRFLAMLGHELRNPLAAISNAISVLLLRSSREVGDMHEIIRRQTRQLTAIVDDLLDVARASSGKLQLSREPLDLGVIAQRTKEVLDASGIMGGKEVRLDVVPTFVNGDAERLSQVARNLMENAAKYTPSGGKIEIEVRPERSTAILRVRDDGRGISPDLLPHIFDPFVQAPQSIERPIGGLGLGLAIVKQVVALHNGTVEARSDGVDKGAEFVVRLPLLTALASTAAHPAEASSAARPVRALVIEDHDDTRASVVTLLRTEGHHVQDAPDGLTGLALLQQQSFDVALVDIGLPGIDGYELVRRARASGVACRFVAVTGYGQDRDREQAAQAGFDDFLVKPLSWDQLRIAVFTVNSGVEAT